MRQFHIDLGVTPGELLGTLPVEGDAIFAAVDFERSEIHDILVLPDLSIQFINSMVQPVLFPFLLLDGSGALQFGGVQSFELLRDALGFGLELAGLARQHLTNDSAHLIADFGIAARFGSLALQRAELFLDFHHDVIDTREIHLGGFQLGFRKPLLGFEFGDTSGFFDDGATLHGLGGENQSDAALFDDGVRVRPQAHAHEHFLDIAEPSHTAIDQVFALAGTIEPPADHDFARFHGQNQLV